MANCEMANVAQ